MHYREKITAHKAAPFEYFVILGIPSGNGERVLTYIYADSRCPRVPHQKRHRYIAAPRSYIYIGNGSIKKGRVTFCCFNQDLRFRTRYQDTFVDSNVQRHEFLHTQKICQGNT